MPPFLHIYLYNVIKETVKNVFKKIMNLLRKGRSFYNICRVKLSIRK